MIEDKPSNQNSYGNSRPSLPGKSIKFQASRKEISPFIEVLSVPAIFLLPATSCPHAMVSLKRSKKFMTQATEAAADSDQFHVIDYVTCDFVQFELFPLYLLLFFSTNIEQHYHKKGKQ